jgi:hypothetical protein
MNSREIEIWALRVIKQAQANQPSEDKLSELKREWPTDYNKAARCIAGRANAAGGEPIRWLIGVDENSGTVMGANHQELTKWLAVIGGQFETCLNSPYCMAAFRRSASLNISLRAITAWPFTLDKA